MCLFDWQFGRFIVTTRRIVTLEAAADTLLASRSSQRAFIELWPDTAASSFNWDIAEISAASVTPIVSALGPGVARFNLVTSGDFCQNEFHAFVAGAGAQVTVIEGWLPEQAMKTTLADLTGKPQL